MDAQRRTVATTRLRDGDAAPARVNDSIWLSRIITSSWLIVNWALLPLLILISFLGTDPWMSGVLAITSPLTVGVFGLLGMVPRIILKRRGITSVPAPLACCLVTHWCATTLAVLFLSGGGPYDSLLGGPLRLWHADEGELVRIALSCVAAAWVAECAIAATTQGRRPRPGWLWLSVLVTLAMPTAFVLGALAMQREADATPTTPDATGLDRAAALAITDAEAARAQYERAWDEVQAQLAPIRSAIAEQHWSVVPWTSDPSHNSHPELRSYRVTMSWHTVGLFDADDWYERLEAAIIAAGGTDIRVQIAGLTAELPGERHLDVRLEPVDDSDTLSDLVLHISAGDFWTPRADPHWQKLPAAPADENALVMPDGGPRTYRGDTWPTLEQVLTSEPARGVSG